MVPFDILVEIDHRPVSLWVEQLDYLADENGLMRFDVRGDDRRVLLSVDVEADPAHPDFSFEAMQAVDETFSGEELLAMIKAIRDEHNRPAPDLIRLPFNN